MVTKQISLTLDEDIIKKIRKESEEQDRSLSKIANNRLKKSYERGKKKDAKQ